ncbi:MAG: hypothetical protein AAF363_14155 [Bacteroidota bacterium]
MSVFKERIYSLLEQAELKPEATEEQLTTDHSIIKAADCKTIYNALGGQKDWKEIEPFLSDITVSGTHIFVDGYKDFNRYRSETIKSDLYDSFSAFDLSSYKRFCRNFEKECIKSGANRKDWTSKTAEYHFGDASDPGDFYKNGSPLWKLNAFRNLLSDHYYSAGKKFVRISIYDNLMINGSLNRLDKLLLTSNPVSEPPIIKYLSRRLGLIKQL